MEYAFESDQIGDCLPHSVTEDAFNCVVHCPANVCLPSDWLPHRKGKGQQVMDDNWAKEHFHYLFLINPFMPDTDWQNPSRDDLCDFLNKVKAFKKSI